MCDALKSWNVKKWSKDKTPDLREGGASSLSLS
jgi:hypothetical protein